MFEVEKLNEALKKARSGNVSDVFPIFVLLNEYIAGHISQEDFLGDLQAILGETK